MCFFLNIHIHTKTTKTSSSKSHVKSTSNSLLALTIGIWGCTAGVIRSTTWTLFCSFSGVLGVVGFSPSFSSVFAIWISDTLNTVPWTTTSGKTIGTTTLDCLAVLTRLTVVAEILYTRNHRPGGTQTMFQTCNRVVLSACFRSVMSA